MGLNNNTSSAACSPQRWIVTVLAVSLLAYIFLSFRSLQLRVDLPSHQTASQAIHTHTERQEQQVISETPNDGGSSVSSSIVHSPEVFTRNYAEMDQKFKVYIYPDGDPNTFFQTPRKLTGKYASEGQVEMVVHHSSQCALYESLYRINEMFRDIDGKFILCLYRPRVTKNPNGVNAIPELKPDRMIIPVLGVNQVKPSLMREGDMSTELELP
eukprot:Gb_30301 [translate_table: standard]